jgi:hypothetical protein
MCAVRTPLSYPKTKTSPRNKTKPYEGKKKKNESGKEQRKHITSPVNHLIPSKSIFREGYD